MVEKFLDYMKNFDFLDFVGFAKLLSVEEQYIKDTVLMAGAKVSKEDALQELVVEIIYQFEQLNRKKRKEILKLAKQIYLNNADFDRLKDSDKSPTTEVINNGE